MAPLVGFVLGERVRSRTVAMAAADFNRRSRSPDTKRSSCAGAATSDRQSRGLVPSHGFEPWTYRLRSGCLATWPYRLSNSLSVFAAVTQYSSTSYHITSLPNTSYHITSLPITSYHFLSHHITSYHFLSLPNTSYHITSLPITSHHFLSLSKTSYHFLTLPITSRHFLSHHITSYHFLRLPITS